MRLRVGMHDEGGGTGCWPRLPLSFVWDARTVTGLTGVRCMDCSELGQRIWGMMFGCVFYNHYIILPSGTQTNDGLSS